MLKVSGRMTSFQARTGQLGSGEPEFGSNLLGHEILVQLIDPSAFYIDQYANRGMRLETRIVVNRHPFVVAGRIPEIGDRVTVKTDALMSVARTGEIIDTKSTDGDAIIELRIGQRQSGGAS